MWRACGRPNQARGFELGELIDDAKVETTTKRNGTRIRFKPTPRFQGVPLPHGTRGEAALELRLPQHGLTLYLNGEVPQREWPEGPRRSPGQQAALPHRAPSGEDIEVAITHTDAYGEDYQSFVNGQFTPQGERTKRPSRGVHQGGARLLRQGLRRPDIRGGISAAVAVKVEEPVFESQTKTKLAPKTWGRGAVAQELCL